MLVANEVKYIFILLYIMNGIFHGKIMWWLVSLKLPTYNPDANP